MGQERQQEEELKASMTIVFSSVILTPKQNLPECNFPTLRIHIRRYYSKFLHHKQFRINLVRYQGSYDLGLMSDEEAVRMEA